jgi:hypothetical protein
MAMTKKTDRLDAKGLAILLRNSTLPEVWIPPGELRDQRELLCLRIFLVPAAAASQESHPRSPLQRAAYRHGSDSTRKRA